MNNLFKGDFVDYEPLTENRFLIEFPTQLELLNNVAIKVSTPTIKYKNGEWTWMPIKITFIDHVGLSSSAKVIHWLRMHTKDDLTLQGYACGYLLDIKSHAVDPTGISVQKWTFKNCKIIKAKFSKSSSKSKKLKKVKLIIQPEYCTLDF